MSNDTLTPRTDAAQDHAWNGPFSGEPETQAWQLARDLEVELTAAQAEIAELRAKCERLEQFGVHWCMATKEEMDACVVKHLGPKAASEKGAT